MPDQIPKTKVAVLGGGVGSIVTAFELTSTPALREKYDVTIYQLGWRIGGKGASGRNMSRQLRIEEHGLHIWFGFYENAFNCIERCYEELGRAAEAPLATWTDAFLPNGAFVLNEQYHDEWVEWSVDFPGNSSTPGDGTVLPSIWDMAEEFLGWVWEIFHDIIGKIPHEPQKEPVLPWWKRLLYALLKLLGIQSSSVPRKEWQKPHWWDKLVAELEADVEAELSSIVRYEELKLLALARQLVQKYSKSPGTQPPAEHISRLCEMLTAFKNWLWTDWVEPHMDVQDLRELFVLLDIGSTILCGIHQDGILEHGFASVNHIELRDWLRKHGAREAPTLTLESDPILKAMYDVSFAFEGGDTNHPNIEAGTALSGMLRLAMTYKGSIYWKMQAGMGDTIFAPFYEVLRRRGVKFKFFHAVDQLIVDSSTQEVSEIDIIPQVKLTVGEYDPLIMVRDLPCWPSEPLWEQLQDGERLRRAGVNFEENYNPLHVPEPIKLKKGTDFDLVVLGISLGALSYVCRDIIQQNTDWKNMIDHVKTVRTQSFQVWVNKSNNGLGGSYNPQAIIGSYVEPLDTFCNMDQLIKRENWPAPFDLGNIAYVCGVLKDELGGEEETVNDIVKANGIHFMGNHIEPLWPKVVRTRPGFKPEFEWMVLIDPEDRELALRFDAQFWRANYDNTEVYVQSVTGSTLYRLRADGSGYRNLYLAGDWLQNGFNVGHVESATASGRQASRAICGVPQEIPGEKDPWI